MSNSACSADISKCIEVVGYEVLQAYINQKFTPKILSLNYYTTNNAEDWLDVKDFMRFSVPYLSREQSSAPDTAASSTHTSVARAQFASHISIKTEPLETSLVHSSQTPSSPCHTRVKSEPLDTDLHSSQAPVPSHSPSPTTGSSKSINVNSTSKSGNSSSLSSQPTLQPDGNLSAALKAFNVIEINDSSDEDLPAYISIAKSRKSKVQETKKTQKRKHAERSDSDSDSIQFISKTKTDPSRTRSKKKKRTKSKNSKKREAESSDSQTDELVLVKLTRQLAVKQLKTINEIPTTWTIIDGAWLLDIRDDDREWKDAKTGELLSMAAIIKKQDQDSWAKGSSGSTVPSKATSVIPLDNQKCQVGEHPCQGVYHCSELDMSLLEGHKRYSPDDDEMRHLFEAEREVNIAETSTVEARAASFYKDCLRKKCPAKVPSDDPENPEPVPCEGEAVYRKYKKTNFDGKTGFIGCSLWVMGKKNDHRFMGIPRDVKESLVKELFESENGTFSGTRLELDTGKCARVLSARHAGGGMVVQGTLVKRPCPAKIKIYSPLDRADRRAIVIVTGPHNHPRIPPTKLSREGKDKYEEAVVANGVSRSTVLKCDIAPTTKRIFNGLSFADVDPALTLARNRRKIIHNRKNKDNPFGNDLEAVIYQKRKDDRELAPSFRYIHEVSTKDGVDMVITMLSDLAERIHSANATLHDNTYKRVFGDWKEWEVVIWDNRLNIRITVARIYCNRETRISFEQLWSGFWNTVARITSKAIQFKFLDGVGILSIVVDGSKPQANGCGDALVKQIALRGKDCTFTETDPLVIVQHILRTCDIHLERKLDDLAKTLPVDVMERIRGFPFLQTREEVNDFVKWCEESEHKNVRDWMLDKKSSPWFIPSVNRFMSKIPENDWFLTPGHTNLNESAHPLTNMHTGTGLSLFDAIREARILDSSVLQKLNDAEQNCILPNSHNTQAERDRANRLRQESRARKRTERTVVVDGLHEIREEINDLTQVHQNATQRKKELRKQEKAIQEAIGLKRSPQKKNNARGKSRLPAENALSDNENTLDNELGVSASSLSTQHSDTPYPIPPHYFGNDMANTPGLPQHKDTTGYQSDEPFVARYEPSVPISQTYNQMYTATSHNIAGSSHSEMPQTTDNTTPWSQYIETPTGYYSGYNLGYAIPGPSNFQARGTQAPFSSIPMQQNTPPRRHPYSMNYIPFSPIPIDPPIAKKPDEQHPSYYGTYERM